MSKYEQEEHELDLSLCPPDIRPLSLAEIRRIVPPGVRFPEDDERMVRRLGLCLAHPLKATIIEQFKWMNKNHAENENYWAELGNDFAPLSFRFAYMRKKNGESQCWMHGGLIFHGGHDGNGSGRGPTFSVTLDSADGWRLHT